MTKRYQLGKTTWTQDDHSPAEPLDTFTCNHAWSLPHHILIEMGATPIADKPECNHEWDIEAKGGCCFKCGKFWDKPEKIDMPHNKHIVYSSDVASEKMWDWMTQITKAVNSLKEN